MMDIQTERLRLRRFNEEHLSDEYVGWLNDGQLMRFSEQRHKTHTRETCRTYLESFVDTPHCFWAIEERKADFRHIGNINAHVDENNGVADIGILIGHGPARGRGFGQEAWAGVVSYLFDKRKVRKVTAGMLTGNAAMVRLAEEAGMIPDGVRRRHYLVDGKEMDIIYMALFAQNWSR